MEILFVAKVNKAQKWWENLKFTTSFPPSFEGENCINYIYAINMGLLNHTGSTSSQCRCSVCTIITTLFVSEVKPVFILPFVSVPPIILTACHQSALHYFCDMLDFSPPHFLISEITRWTFNVLKFHSALAVADPGFPIGGACTC